jgi:hypothetical protein
LKNQRLQSGEDLKIVGSFTNLSKPGATVFVDENIGPDRAVAILAHEHLLASLAFGDTHKATTPSLLSCSLKLFREIARRGRQVTMDL